MENEKLHQNRKPYEGTYYVGVDMGTNSVGYAATDPFYEVIKKHGKALWGIRLFESAQTAEGRRLYRGARRRLARRTRRIQLLQELFSKEICKKDPGFFQRLRDSALYEEDKSVKQPNSLFNDVDFDDKSYHKAYPTIYHLRYELMTLDKAFDVRLVYLAIHHILKHRGHFLYNGLSENDKGIPDFGELYEQLGNVIERVFDGEKSIPADKKEAMQNILLDKKSTAQTKSSELLQCLGDEKDTTYKAIAKLITGLKANLSDLYNRQELKDEAWNGVAFTADELEQTEEMQSVLQDSFDLLIVCKEIFDWSRLAGIMRNYKTISEAKVAAYEDHGKDLKSLKQLLNFNKDLYGEVFKSTGKDTYAAYVGTCKSKGKKISIEQSCSQEDFYKKIKSILNKVPDSKQKSDVLEKIKLGTFLPKSVSKSNALIPYQVHMIELKKILRKAEKYLPFLKESDEYGTVSEKIESLMSFRMPYYVGPTNVHANHQWIAKIKEGPIYPWNFDDMVDKEKSAENFIKELTNKCTYLIGEDVLPKNSLLYSKFMVLNELNQVRIGHNGLKLDQITEKPGLKMRIYENLFLNKKNVTRKVLQNYLVREEGLDKAEVEVIGGIDEHFNASLAPWIDLEKILGKDFQRDLGEKIIEDIEIFHDAPKMLKERLCRACPKLVNAPKTLQKLLQLRPKGWGRLSRKLLTDIYPTDGKPVNKETGEVMNMITALEKTSHNLMELLSSDFKYMEAIEKVNKPAEEKLEINYDTVKQLYVSPAVKRPLWQALRIVKEITKIMGKPPARIFIEMAKSPDEIKNKTVSRKERLLQLYKNCKKEEPALFASLEKCTEEDLRNDKLYLYYTQMGKSMYTQETIALEDLQNENRYDIDHIYPRSATGDDSLSNRVLVEKVVNGAKSDSYPLHVKLNGYTNAKEGISIRDIQKERRAFWKMLVDRGLISEEKYRRLIRTTPLSASEKATFIGRQLVETRQSTKACAAILKSAYPNTEIVYAKAKNVSMFRQYGRMLEIREIERKEKRTLTPEEREQYERYEFIKVRDLNDYHHAKDAYLNIVVGNAFYTQFTQNPMNFFKEKELDQRKAVYSMNPEAFYGRTIQRKGQVAWRPEEDGTMATVRKWMKRNNILFTRMPFIGQGQLFDVNILKKGNGQVPLKKGRDIAKYGGYNKASIAYFMLVCAEDKKNRNVYVIEPIPTYLQEQVPNDSAKQQYCGQVWAHSKSKQRRDWKNPRVIISCIPMQSLFSVNGYRMHITGKTNDRLFVRNAEQLCLDVKDADVLKRVLKINSRQNVCITNFDKITEENTLNLYEAFIEKLKDSIYHIKFADQGDKLQREIESFKKLDLVSRCRLLEEILHFFQCNATISDLSMIGGSKQAGALTINSKLDAGDQPYLLLQSITGFYEKKIPLVPEA